MYTELEVKHLLRDFNLSTGCTFNVMISRTDKLPGSAITRCVYRGYRKSSIKVLISENRQILEPFSSYLFCWLSQKFKNL